MHDMKRLNAPVIVREARTRAGLSQRALAERAGTAQSVVARVESGVTNPTAETLLRLVEAAGFDVHAEITPTPVVGTHMLDDVERILRLSPEERLIEVRNVSRFVHDVRRV